VIFLKNFITGIFIGIGCIIPGVSSGVFCVIFGIYEKLIYSVLHFFSDIKNNSKFLFPITCGALLSIFVFANILIALFSNFYMPTSFAFIGLIIGSIPIVIKQARIT
jgi:putative membrane protein